MEQPGRHIDLTSLENFARSLGTWNFANGQGGIADEDGQTRQEASLLLSLSSSTTECFDGMMSSDVSLTSTSRYSDFHFSCPSLSLERSMNSARSTTRRKQNAPPAVLLRRPLIVEDSDALRLNAEAMARNLLQSFQKALEWRIQTWKSSVARSLVKREKEMMAQGVNESQLCQLCSTPAAKLLKALEKVHQEVQVTGAGTNFHFLSDSTISSPPPRKRRRRESTQDSINNYSVKHEIVLDCIVTLQTPAGHSEVALQVPGTMEGTFDGPQEMTSVVLELNTDMLAAMLEKSCRKVARWSAETIMTASTKSKPKETEDKTAAMLVPTTQGLVSPHPRSLAESTPLSSPTPKLSFRSSLLKVPKDVMVTPPPRARTLQKRPSSSMLLTIPDECLGEETVPSCVSPPPQSLRMLPRTPLSLEGSELALVSPPPTDCCVYSDIHQKSGGPSLPMLVEVACRARQTA